jgi:hypothetical protein
MTDQFQVPPGAVCMTTYGAVTAETLGSWGEMRAYCGETGLKNLGFMIVMGSLVDKTRNEAVVSMLNSPAQWLLFIDGDMQWPKESAHVLLQTAYQGLPWADVVGAWCPLRGSPYLPTIDPGSGTWEPIAPGGGPIEVMRTGGAFLLIKRHVFERMPAPWYGVRTVGRPIDAMLEVDNFARQKFDGQNPLRKSKEWQQLESIAAQLAHSPANAVYPFSSVGEDSNFCDRAKGMGFRIVVQTNLTINHVDRKVITADDHLDAMKHLRDQEALATGVFATIG